MEPQKIFIVLAMAILCRGTMYIAKIIDFHGLILLFPVMRVAVADLKVVSTKPQGDVVVPVSPCVEFSCVVEGGRAGWIINVGQGDHQFRHTDPQEGVYINSTGGHSLLALCGHATPDIIIKLQCFAYQLGLQSISRGNSSQLRFYGEYMLYVHV